MPAFAVFLIVNVGHDVKIVKSIQKLRQTMLENQKKISSKKDI
jgi:hypothetical protein